MANAYPNIVAIQMTSSPLVEDNLLFVEQQLKLLPTQRPCLVVLPECFACFGGGDKLMMDIAEDLHLGRSEEHTFRSVFV